VALVIVSLLHSCCFLVRSRASLQLEIVALRHQLAVVNRSRRPRLRFTAAVGVAGAAMARLGARCSTSYSQLPSWPGIGVVFVCSGPGRADIARAAGSVSRPPRVDSRDVHHESAVAHLGSTANSSDRCQIHAAAATANVANVAELPDQSREPDHGRRSLRRAHSYLPAALCPRDPRTRPSGSFTWRSPSTRPLLGRHNSFAMSFPRTSRRDIYSTIVIRSLRTWRPPSPG
jgi:hypothetical protein